MCQDLFMPFCKTLSKRCIASENDLSVYNVIQNNTA